MLGREWMRALARVAVVLTVVACLLFAIPSLAAAYDETTSGPEAPIGHTYGTAICYTCHGAANDGTNGCLDCHGPPLFGASPQFGAGPHAGYMTGSQRCGLCHSVHSAPVGVLLLPRSTVTAVCNTCHDGTGGKGVYNTIQTRTGLPAGGMHSVDTTNMIPGGDPTTGGSLTATFAGVGGTLTCTDCHSPHDANTVADFVGDRRRVPYTTTSRESWQVVSSDRLLKAHPNSVVATITDYGSDWCLSCHRGRMAQGSVHNHPVDAKTLRSDAFTYQNVAILSSDSTTSVTVMGSLGGSNRGYIMLDPRTAQQGDHGPICQQCHSDTRSTVGTMTGSAAAAQPFSVSLDGTVSATFPRFQNFPHETVNARMTVETGDDLCTNCHPPVALP